MLTHRKTGNRTTRSDHSLEVIKMRVSFIADPEERTEEERVANSNHHILRPMACPVRESLHPFHPRVPQWLRSCIELCVEHYLPAWSHHRAVDNVRNRPRSVMMSMKWDTEYGGNMNPLAHIESPIVVAQLWPSKPLVTPVTEALWNRQNTFNEIQCINKSLPLYTWSVTYSPRSFASPSSGFSPFSSREMPSTLKVISCEQPRHPS